MLRPFLLVLATLLSTNLIARSPDTTAPSDTSHLPATTATAEELVEAAFEAKSAGNAAEATALYERAAALGSPTAKRTLAISLRFGRDEANKVRARTLLLEAAEAGYAPGMLDFAQMAARGIGGPVDGPAAVHWATRAFEDHQENTGVTLLGVIYEEGLGVPRDLAKALAWYERGEAAGYSPAATDAKRLRAAARMTPEEKLVAFQAALDAVRHTGSYHRDRGRTFWNYVRSLHDGGLTVEETTTAAAPGLRWLMEKDFHALAFGLAATGQRFRPGIEAQLTAQQREVIEQIRKSYASRHAPKPPIALGQGWSEVFGPPPTVVAAGAPPAVAPSPKPQTAQSAVVATPAKPVRELSEFTRDAKTWEEFFAGAARRQQTFFSRHLSDVIAFRQQHPATSEQLRAAYLRARATLRPTPGTVRGLEYGAQFVAYHLALLENGLSETDAAAWVRNDFLQLARSDIYNAHHVLMGVQNLDPLRKLLPPQLNSQVREIAGRVVKREPLPKVPAPRVPAAAVAATSPPASKVADPIGAAKELYAKLYAELAARDKGVALLPEEQQALDALARLLPQARQKYSADIDRKVREFASKEPGNNELAAANRAVQEKRFDDALPLFEKAAAVGSSSAKLTLASYTFNQNESPLSFERRKELLEEAFANGMPGAPERLCKLHFEGEKPNLDEVIRWARTALEAEEFESARLLYLALLQKRRSIERDPAQFLASSGDPKNQQAATAELNEALGHLRDASLHGDVNAMYELARYHLLGQPPGLRPTFRFNRPEHNLHLARFWFQRVLEMGGNLSESARSNIPRWIGEIDATFALAKSREWTADEVIAALDGGTSQNHVSWLLAREGGTFSKREHTRILTSEGGKKIGDYSDLGMQLGLMVVTGPDREARDLAAAAIAARRQTAKPLPFPGDDMEALRRGYEAGDPAAAYALLRLLPPRHFGGWPKDAPPRDQVRVVALSQDYAPAQYLRIDWDKLVRSQDPMEFDLPQAFALLLASAQAGSAEAARNVADFYRGQSHTPVRPNLVEAEWWYAQAAALAWPKQFESTGGILEPERNLAHLYMLERASIAGGIGLNARDPAAHRWLRELRARGGAAREIAEERIAYYGTSDAGRLNLEGFIAALPPAMPLMSEDERAQLERDAAAGKTEARLRLARALALGEGGFRQDDARAVALYLQAAEAGSTEAITALIEQLRGGFGVKRDFLAALAWQDRAEGKTRDRVDHLIEAARQASFEPRANYLIAPYLREAIALGSVEAKSTLGAHLMTGRVVKKDVEEGMRLLTQAAEAGNMRAMTSLSFHYREGKEVPQDLAAAHVWRVRAAEAGDKNSIHALVGDFDRGENGAPVDAREALRFARLSEAKWIRDSIVGRERDVATLDRNPGMTTEELRKAKVRQQMQFYDTAMAVTAAATGETEYIRAAGLQGEARLSALREAARKGYIRATRELIDELTSTDNLHEAHWWAGRDWQLENSDTELEAKVLRDNLQRRAGFNVIGLKTEETGFGGKVLEGFTTARDQSLERSMPELAQALANAGGNPRRLVAEVEQVRDRFPDRAESHIALAQLSMDRPDFARSLLEKAIELDRTHPQAHVLLARLEASSGQPYRAYYRLLELAQARPNSVQVATARAELLHALGGSKKERTDLRLGLRRLLEEATPPERFNGYVAAAKLAAGADDLDNAVADLSAAIAINRARALLFERGQLHERRRDYPRALEDYLALLALPGVLNPQQTAELNARIARVRQTMNAETVRMQGEVEMMDETLARIDAFKSEESQQEMSSMMDRIFFFVSGNKAYEAGDIEKAREHWTKAAKAGHAEAAAKLKALPEE